MTSSNMQHTGRHDETQSINHVTAPSYSPSQERREHILEQVQNVDISALNKLGISQQDQHYNTFRMFQAVSGTLVSLFLNKEGNNTHAFEKFQSTLNEIMNKTLEHAKHDMKGQDISEKLQEALLVDKN